jgi:hypothetical protein
VFVYSYVNTYTYMENVCDLYARQELVVKRTNGRIVLDRLLAV